MSARNDVAIYMPYAASMYARDFGRTGGAERQTILLARSLVAAGLDVAHIVFPIAYPRGAAGDPELVVRPTGRWGRLGRLFDSVHIWRAMARADARTYVFRGASGVVGIGAAFCLVHRRRLVFSGANDRDFTDPPMSLGPRRAKLFWWGLRHAAAVVTQSARQREIAAERLAPQTLSTIPSFVEASPADAEAEAFLWVGRVVDYKRPEAYLALARAVPEARFRMVPVATEGDTAGGQFEALIAEAAQLPNVEVLAPQPHAELMGLVERAIAIVNTSTVEGMPNVWLEGWARGVPALTLGFDPDHRVRDQGLGLSGEEDPEAFAAAARSLWERRADRGGFGAAVRTWVEATHGPDVVVVPWRRVLAA